MEAKELKVSNIVDCKNKRHGEKYIEVESITSEEINVNFRPYFVMDLTPITLTEEWLLKFGFEENKRVNKIIVKSFSKNISFIGTYKTLSVSVEVGNTYIYIREGDELIDRSKDDIICLFNSDYRGKLYVHQLQNLYFALTGEELTIKYN